MQLQDRVLTSSFGRERSFPSGYRPFFLIVLLVIYAANYADRLVLYVLLQRIPEDLGLRDWQVGLLGGGAFAIFYTVAGLPIARLADRGRRVTIITVCLTLWSGMAVLCGLTANFAQLLCARVGVAVGEGGCTPSAHALINVLYPPQRRASALGVYAAGSSVGAFVGLYAGGALADLYGWRTAFVIVGAPGLLLALLVLLTLREPVLRPDRSLAVQPSPGTLGEIVAVLLSRPSFRFVVLAAALAALAGEGMTIWTPSFLHRSHHLSLSDVGRWMAFAQLIAGCAGLVAGGYLSDRMAKRGVGWRLWLPALVLLVGAPFALALLFAPDLRVVIACLFAITFATTFFAGPTFSAVHSVIGANMRATATAFVLLFVTLVGTGVGPVAIGLISDLLRGGYGEESLRMSLLVSVACYLLSAIAFFFAG